MEPDPRTGIVVAYALQVLATTLLSGILLGYGRRDAILRLWGWAWLALAVGLTGAGAGVAALMAGWDPDGIGRTSLAVLNVAGRVSHALLLPVGAWALARQRRPPARWVIGALVVGVVLAVGAVIATMGTEPATRVLVRVRLPALLIGTASLVAAGAVLTAARREGASAPVLLAAALLAWSVQQLVFLLGSADAPPSPYYNFLDAAALIAVAISSVYWFLQREERRVAKVRDEVDRAQWALRRRLAAEEVLQETSALYLHASADEAPDACRAALARLVGHLGARAGVVVETTPAGPSVVARWPVAEGGPDDLGLPPPLGDGLPDALARGRLLRRPTDGGLDLFVPCEAGGGVVGVVGLMGLAAETPTTGDDEAWFRLAGEACAAFLARVATERRGDAIRARLEAAFRAFPDSVTISRQSDGVFLDVNDGFERLTGWTRDEVVGRSSKDLRIWADPGQRQRMVEALLARGHVDDLPCDFRMRDGRIRRFLVSAEALMVAGEPCLLAVSRDRTEVLRLEEELRQAQRLEAIGRLAGGVAHDFNNLLTVVGAYAQELLLDDLPDGTVRQAATEILEAQRRGGDLTRRLLAFARRQAVDPAPVEVDRVVGDMAALLRRLLDADTRLELDLEGGEAVILADRTQLEQAVVNLVVNARDAMPDGGRLRVATRRHRFDAAELVEGTAIPAGDWVELSVFDEGSGIQAEHVASIFDPFFTTKEVGRGTGLGLSTVYGAVQAAGGHIALRTEPGAGSEFRLFFPEADPDHVRPAPEPVTVSVESSVSDGTTILLVEDEPALRSLFRRVLEREGYRVLEAADGRDVLRWLDDAPEAVDLLLTDVLLPGADGAEIAQAFRRRMPDGDVLFMTGYYDEGRGAVPASSDRVLRKPFTSAELIAQVAEVLSARDPASD